MLPFKIDLTGKVAVVTGGGGILCSEMAQALGECGAKVAVVDLHQENADQVADLINSKGGVAAGFTCNVTDKASVEEANKKIVEQFGPCDILINGAGGNHPKGTSGKETITPQDLTGEAQGQGSFYELDPEGFRWVFDLNLTGTVITSQVFTRDMAARGSGVVINISSMSAFTPLTKVSAYSAAKAAVSNFTLWLSTHLAPCGVRVNAIAPGFFLTNQNRRLLTNEDGSSTPRGNLIITGTPMKRYGTPSELIGTLLWLVCDQASGFVTGTVIPVDGGFNAFSGV